MTLLNTDWRSLLPGLKPAAWRGIQFHMPDSSHEVGRRIVLTYFPGLDQPAAEDLGRHSGLVRVSGLIIGDDYISRALSLQGAMHGRGPGTLLHPWLGEMTVIVPEGGANIHFMSRELRVVRFDCVFQPVPVSFAPASLSTLGAVLSGVTTLLSAAQGLIGAVLGLGTLGVASWAAAVETAGAIGAAVGAAALSSHAAAAIAPVLDPAQEVLTAALGLGAGPEAAQALAAALVDLPRPLADVAIGTPEPAIGAGPLATGDAAPSLSARAGADMLLALALTVRDLPAHGALAEAVRLSAQVALLGQAVRTAAEIDYESRQEAVAWRARLDDALDQAASDLAAAQDAWAGERAYLWSALADLGGALAQDMHEIIGRLPPVLLFTPQATVSAWILAQHFAGDDPRQVVPMFDDIVRRNRLPHPGAIPAGAAIEVLLR